ncbi:MAG: hypothetical protein OEX80_08960 [Candidatus Aminicenantes bacterium]|nr:hypothetical protein [Candidatus Aminicenantes bacterium]
MSFPEPEEIRVRRTPLRRNKYQPSSASDAPDKLAMIEQRTEANGFWCAPRTSNPSQAIS